MCSEKACKVYRKMLAMVSFFKFQARGELYCRYFTVNLFKSFRNIIFTGHLRTTALNSFERGISLFTLFPIVVIPPSLLLLYFFVIILNPKCTNHPACCTSLGALALLITPDFSIYCVNTYWWYDHFDIISDVILYKTCSFSLFFKKVIKM